MKFATPNPSPSKRTAVRQGSCVTPLNKKQRLFSPTSPGTSDKFDTRFRPSNLFSQPSPSDSFDTSIDSMNCSLGCSDSQTHRDTANSQDDGVVSDDVMMCSPPRIERLQLFDYPRTPASIARSSGIHVAAHNQSQSRNSRQPKGLNSWNRYDHLVVCTVHGLRFYSLFCYRVKRCAGRVTRSGPELRRLPSRGTNINPFTPIEVQGRSRNGGLGITNEYQGETWASTPLGIKDEIKPQKVYMYKSVLVLC